MQQHATSAAQPHELSDTRQRTGLAISGPDAAAGVAAIVAADAAGVTQVWMTQTAPAPDTLTLFAAAATQTRAVRLGTAIVPTYPRHPLALAQQALALADLAPGRLRLGVGPSHRAVMEGVYGLPVTAPLEHLREYVSILRAALWQGRVDFEGRFFRVKATLPRTPQTPLLVSALRTGAFHLAGAIADGAISWMCPVPYLIERALPALRAGAAAAGRATPALVAHVPVALSADRAAVLAAARGQIGRYARMPFYASMFGDAGYPIAADGTMPDALLETLVVSGDEDAVAARLKQLLAAGLDELLLMPIAIEEAATDLRRVARLIGQL